MRLAIPAATGIRRPRASRLPKASSKARKTRESTAINGHGWVAVGALVVAAVRLRWSAPLVSRDIQ